MVLMYARWSVEVDMDDVMLEMLGASADEGGGERAVGGLGKFAGVR